MMRSILLAAVVLTVLALTIGLRAEPGSPAPPKDPAKQIADLESRISDLEKTAKGADVVGLAKSIDGRLQVIQGKVPELERWSMAAARLEQIASDVRTTRAWTLFILVVAVALAVASLVMASRYQRDLVRARESAGRAIEAMVRTVTDRRSTPIVVGVNPLAGPTAGGTPVRIRGRNFDQRTTVRFGDALANAITTMSADVILASTPAGPSGPCDITVQNWDGGVDTRRDGYTFMAAPVIQGVFPSTSPIAAPCSRYSAPISSRTRPCSSTASGLPRCTSPRTTLPASSHPAQRIRR